jgi:hypothetical protein
MLLPALLFPLAGPTSAQDSAWRSLRPGLELANFAASSEGLAAELSITVVRIDPELWDLTFVGNSGDDASELRTARDWSKEAELSVAINAGMFATDYRSHVGYLREGSRVNSPGVNKYQSVAAFGPRGGSGQPRFRIFDLDDPSTRMSTIQRDYELVVQNLRLIKRPRENRWSPQDKRWSEAALGEDAQGRILFIFCRSPFSMHELNEQLLALDLGLVAAQHLEGGPEAQLYLAVEGFELELIGSFETDFLESEDNLRAWPVPNVLGIRPRVLAPSEGGKGLDSAKQRGDS